MAEFDIGVLLGSQSDDIFDEYAAMHKGVVRLRRFSQTQCKCGERDCFRHCLQGISGLVSDDPELMGWFLKELEGFEPLQMPEFTKTLDALYDRAKAAGKLSLE